METLSARKSEIKKVLDELILKAEKNSYQLLENDKSKYVSLKDELEALEHKEKVLAKVKATFNTVFVNIYEEAYDAGMKAGEEAIPNPMMVVGTTVGGKEVIADYVSEGVCGFAWVAVRPSYCKFGTWLRAMDYGRYSSYDKAVLIWCHEFGQSMTRKEAFAKAFAEVLVKHDINCYARSRLD